MRLGYFIATTLLWTTTGSPLAAQESPADIPATQRLEAAAAQTQRLDFAAALDSLTQMIDAGDALSPQERAAALAARAAVHTRMRRPGLALADLDSARRLDPDDPSLPRAAAALLSDLGQDEAARTALASAAALEAPAQPARPTADTRAPGVSFAPESLMSPLFRVTEGAPDAARELVVVHAANHLADEPFAPDRLSASAGDNLRLTHLFTHTGEDSAIWAAIALICGGSSAYPVLAATLAAPDAAAALAALDGAGDHGPFDAILGAAYEAAGLDPSLLSACALDRGFAVDWLRDWTRASNGLDFRGANIYDSWPVYVLDGAVVAPAALETLLRPADLPEDARTDGVPAGQITATVAPTLPDSAPPDSAPPELPEPQEAPADTAPPPVDPGARGHAPPPPRPNGLGADSALLELDGRMKGVWAASAEACRDYVDRIETAIGLDAALTGPGTETGLPALALVSGQRLELVSDAPEGCTLIAVQGDSTRADLACRGPGGATRALVLSQSPDDRSALTLSRGGAVARYSSCVPLSLLSNRFAPMWSEASDDCMVSVPLDTLGLGFSAGNGEFSLRLAMGEAPATGALEVLVDGAPVGSGALDAEGRLALGPFAVLRERIAAGMVLSLRLGARQVDMPLFGSGAAMERLARCAG